MASDGSVHCLSALAVLVILLTTLLSSVIHLRLLGLEAAVTTPVMGVQVIGTNLTLMQVIWYTFIPGHLHGEL